MLPVIVVNNSSTGGYLSPEAPSPPLEGADLNTFLQALLVGITGLPGKMVRPSFQQEPPVIPQADVPFLVFRYETRPSDQFPFVDDEGNMQRHEDIHILCSFYDAGTQGQADYYAAILRDGLSIDQNLEVLSLNNMGYREIGELVALPIMIKNQWQYRVDLPVVITREVLRSYPIESVDSAIVGLVSDPSNDDAIINNIVVED